MDVPIVSEEHLIVGIEWLDGLQEYFECTRVQLLEHSRILWMRLETGHDRRVPMMGVRWFSVEEKGGSSE